MRRKVSLREAQFRRSLGIMLRDRRVERMLSQADLAASAAVTQSSISNYEIGRSEAPLSVLLLLCQALDLSLADLVDRIVIADLANEDPERILAGAA